MLKSIKYSNHSTFWNLPVKLKCTMFRLKANTCAAQQFDLKSASELGVNDRVFDTVYDSLSLRFLFNVLWFSLIYDQRTLEQVLILVQWLADQVQNLHHYLQFCVQSQTSLCSKEKKNKFITKITGSSRIWWDYYFHIANTPSTPFLPYLYLRIFADDIMSLYCWPQK